MIFHVSLPRFVLAKLATSSIRINLLRIWYKSMGKTYQLDLQNVLEFSTWAILGYTDVILVLVVGDVYYTKAVRTSMEDRLGIDKHQRLAAEYTPVSRSWNLMYRCFQHEIIRPNCTGLLLTIMLLVTNLTNAKWCKNLIFFKFWNYTRVKKWVKSWHMGTHWRALSEIYAMNINMVAFRNLCVRVLWTKVDSSLEGLILKETLVPV